jgi:iron complex outermembrane receptor protein
VLLPYTGAGINFLNADNSDPVNYLDYKYNYYHVPTDFEYVGLHHEFGKNFIIDIKPYTYNYDNSEKYSNAVPITESTTVSFNGNPTSSTWYGTKVQPCMNIVVTTKKGNTIAAEPCGVDKYNSYRKYGETAELSQVSRFGILRTGLWFERGLTNRHQYPSDPLNNWADQALPNFAEKFTTDSYQPFIEYELHIGNNLTVLPGVKWAYYSIGTQQFADDGKTLGCFVPVSPTVGCDPSKNAAVNPNAFVGNSGNYFATLPSLAINYRIRNNWSVYVQGAQGSIVPPSSVFDFQQNTSGGPAYAPLVLPKQQKNTTYQTGTVLKLKHVTFDADYYHIHFDNSYSSFSNASTGNEPVYFLQPSSVSQGIEGQSNINFTHGIGAYLNASFNSNFYTGKLGVSCNTSDKACTLTTPQVVVTAPGGLHIAQTPTDIETEGVTYQHRGWDAAIFGHRVGKQYLDNGQYHNTSTIDPFNTVNAFINYTIRTGGRLDQSKLRLSFNNLFDSHSITNVSYSTSVTGNPLPPANGTTYTDPFTFQGSQAISGADNVSIQSGRSIMLSLTVGFSLHKR